MVMWTLRKMNSRGESRREEREKRVERRQKRERGERVAYFLLHYCLNIWSRVLNKGRKYGGLSVLHHSSFPGIWREFVFCEMFA